MSTPRFLRKIVSGDAAVSQLQANVEQAIAQVIRSPLLDGVLIENVALTTAETKINHKLGRPVRGYLVIRNNNGASVYDNLSTESKPELYLPLLASSSVTVSLWVF